MKTFVVEEQTVHIPAYVIDLDSFQDWFRSEDFPQTGRICYLKGEVWVDMSKEQIFSHNQVKQEYNLVIGGLTKTGKLGRYFPDGVLLTNPDADLSVRPDGIFVSRKTLRSKLIRLIESVHDGYIELEGTPDMVLEVISTSSVIKDTETLLELYWRAGIPEYWLVDARSEPLRFDILRHTPDGYQPARKQAGWVKSTVFGKSFRLSCGMDEFGDPEYTLSVR